MAPARVLNRASDMASNGSKPFQSQVARACGFEVPETLITNDPQEARSFIEDAWSNGQEVIYKSISGVRSIVQTIQHNDLARLDRIRWCPTQFQWRVAGTDLRVHVIGQCAFAVRIESDAIDYRYAVRQQSATPLLTGVDLDPATTARCVALSQALHLPLAGIDLRETPENSLVCFEANPSPAFSYYEDATGVPISMEIARYLRMKRTKCLFAWVRRRRGLRRDTNDHCAVGGRVATCRSADLPSPVARMLKQLLLVRVTTD